MVKWSLDGPPSELYPITPPAIAKNRRFSKIHLKIISSETAGPTLSQVSDYRLLVAFSFNIIFGYEIHVICLADPPGATLVILDNLG